MTRETPSVTVHVHSFRLEPHRGALEGASRTLSPEELARAARFKVPGARDEFLLSRVLLRQTLADRLGLPAERIALEVGPFGKPQLSGREQGALEFNLSHSHGRLLIALSPGSPVGIDIERIDPAIDALALAARSLSPGDVRRLHAAGEDDRNGLFFTLWTRHEAFLKAWGSGFGAPPAETSEREIADGVILRTAPGTGERILIRDLGIAADFRAAVAVLLDDRAPEFALPSVKLEVHDP